MGYSAVIYRRLLSPDAVYLLRQRVHRHLRSGRYAAFRRGQEPYAGFKTLIRGGPVTFGGKLLFNENMAVRVIVKKSHER